MATKRGRMVTYIDGSQAIKSHEIVKSYLHYHIAYGHQTC